MRTRTLFAGAMSAALVGLLVHDASAAPKLRVQVSQNGDFVLLGNTLGHDCVANTPAPVVGTVGNCGNNLGDSAPDVFWRADAPMSGAAQADTTISVAEARTTAVLNLPAGATVTHAYLYWGATLAGAGVDSGVTIERPGAFNQVVQAIESYQSGFNSYHSVADVTSIVQNLGAGAYRISDIDVIDVRGVNNNNYFAGWWMAVFYELPSDPPRNLALFDGLDEVWNNSQNVTLSGFQVPQVFGNAKLGIVAFEGDESINGDQFFFNGGNALTDALNPGDDFFNGTRSFLGNPVSVVGDLPQLTGTPASHSGIDIDVIDITNKINAGDMQAQIQATSSGDRYYLAGFVTSIPTFKPDFTTSQKSAVDKNGAPLMPGDVIEYTIVVNNTGNDTSINTVMTDALPMGVSYVAGTLQITAGANTGAKTDATDSDQCEYVGATRTITCRLGQGADGTKGGQMAVGESTTITFQVTVDPGAFGVISNQAIINAGGLQGAPPADTPTDGNGAGNGVPPTDVIIDQCQNNADCSAPTPICDVSSSPKICVECLMDAHCPGNVPVCDPVNKTCSCVPTGAEVCDGKDNDCDGTVDNGCLDSDGDGIVDDVEILIGTNPNDADSDDDGVLDGQEPLFGQDSDGDGLINALDPDSDNDGLFDGTEMGKDCSNPATDTTKKSCRPDADPTTTTDPLDWDTDDGGVSDGGEDTNLDGKQDSGETDPTAGHGADDMSKVDSDGDGLSDDVEIQLGTDPNDADSDDDGVLDGQEPNPSADSDGDGLIDALDPDSDNDGLFDGTEMGKDCSNPATDTTKKHCIPDGDMGSTTTSPLDPDTDDGGVKDGAEDKNHNGVLDPGETDPTAGHGADDMQNVDTDGDGIPDDVEILIGTDPNDADSDDDGVPDGEEPNWSDDTDGDGKINPLDPDSDNDGILDGTEMGKDCSNPGTDTTKMNCVPDGDMGATTTSPLDPDTDHGGIKDGDEDTNHNGVIDAGETDPNNPADDNPVTCSKDSDCGGPESGKVCDASTGVCINGCRGTDGNGCPAGQVCSSSDAMVGSCMDGAGGGQPDDGIVAQGSGLLCSARAGGQDDGSPAWLLLAGLSAVALSRRRRKV